MSANIVRTSDSCSVSFGHFVRGSVNDLYPHVPQCQIMDGSMGTKDDGFINVESFYRQTSYLGFLSIEFNWKQTKIFSKLARLEFRKACPF